MVYLYLPEQIRESCISESSVKSTFDVVVSFLTVIPSVRQPGKTQVKETTRGHSVTEAIHLSFGPLHPTKLLTSF
jgi:hypothetical protein